jgi:hypothetical protein
MNYCPACRTLHGPGCHLPEIIEMFGGEVEPIDLSDEDAAALDRHMKFVDREGH